jgi:hypothetical protein
MRQPGLDRPRRTVMHALHGARHWRSPEAGPPRRPTTAISRSTSLATPSSDAYVAAVFDVTVRHEQLWMIERAPLLEHTRVGQRPAGKRHEIIDSLRGQIQPADLDVDVVDVRLAEVAAAAVVTTYVRR